MLQVRTGEMDGGAYGLRILGVPGAESLLVPAEVEWPHLSIERHVGQREIANEEITDDRAQLRLKTGGSVLIDRASSTASFCTPRFLTTHAAVHPYLAPPAAVMAHWRGRPCLHAGAFVSDRRAWGVVGTRESGKSSILAWLALHGHPVLSDDVLVIDGESAYAGPRAVDLRADAARRFDVGTPLGVVGARERFRLELGPVETSVAVGGWIFLRWSDEIAVRRLASADLLGRLLHERVLRVDPSNPDHWLELAALPAWEVQRPQTWRSMDDTGSAVLEAVAGA